MSCVSNPDASPSPGLLAGIIISVGVTGIFLNGVVIIGVRYN